MVHAGPTGPARNGAGPACSPDAANGPKRAKRHIALTEPTRTSTAIRKEIP